MNWPSHENFVINQFGVDNEPVIRPSENIWLVLNTLNLDCLKPFEKYMDKNDRFKTISAMFLRLSIQKLYSRIIVGPDIHEVCKNREFIESLDSKESTTFESIVCLSNGSCSK